ncbi:MAG: hypothetical protein ACD_75C01225G0001 [uncultured bacterium]|nr:MAG: hypothetical protein ACD_75C01225G0001 [uncultured bacterium]
MGHPGGDAQHDRGIELFTQIEGKPHHLFRFTRLRRLKHRQFGGEGIVAVILLVLGGVHLRIVGAHQHQPAADSGVGGGKKRVGGDIDPDVFHGGESPGPGKGGADGHFQADLLIGRPFGIYPFIAGEIFHNLGGGGAGIAGGDLHPGFIGAEGNGFVARHPQCVIFHCRHIFS